MATLFTNDFYAILCTIAVFLFRLLYAFVIYKKVDCDSKKTRNLLFALSFPFPIITAIICIVKYRKSVKDLIIILVTLVVSMASVLAIGVAYTYTQIEKYYDKDGTQHLSPYEMNFTDAQGNSYTFDFDKSGYDYFYINNTDERLNSDLCYIDSNGYLIYDEDMSITAKDKNHCVDEDGSIYYPAKYTTFNEDGTIDYIFSNFSYDRLGNAYTYKYVPFYDKDGSKYSYAFDSASQKGYYTNIDTEESFENEYSFVDEDGYFVYDKNHDFVKQDADNPRIYKDSTGKIYYWASSVYWDENGELCY